MFKTLKKLFRRIDPNIVKQERYSAGWDYAAKLFKDLPESLAYIKVVQVNDHPADPYGQGMIDYTNYYRNLQRGNIK